MPWEEALAMKLRKEARTLVDVEPRVNNAETLSLPTTTNFNQEKRRHRKAERDKKLENRFIDLVRFVAGRRR